MNRFICFTGLLLLASPLAAEERTAKPLLRGLKNPAAVVAGTDGRIYVSILGEIGKDSDGAVVVLDKDKAKPFAEGLDDPRGMAARAEWLYVVDKNRVWRIDRKGKASVFAAANAFTPRVHSLQAIDIDEMGMLYVSDAGEGKGGAIYRIDPQGKVSLVTDAKRSPALKSPTGLVMDGLSHLLVIDSASGHLLRLRLEDGSTHKVAEHFGSGGLVWDKQGRLYGSDGAGKVFVIPRPGQKPVLLGSGFQSAAGLGLAVGGGKELDNLFTFLASNYPQYELVINYDAATKKDVSIKKALDNLNILMGSTYEQGFIRFGQFHKAYVETSPEFRRFPEDLDNLFVKNDRGQMVPYSAFMTIKKLPGFNESNRKAILVADTKAGTITPLPAKVPDQEVDDRPLPLKSAIAFPQLKWTGWEPIAASGKMTALRPIVLTHAGDGGNRVFVATQQGVVHVFANDQKATKTSIFLDIHDRVFYDDNENEQGLLGLVFHPDYKKNGEFFLFYTLKKSKTTNVLSRFRVRRDDPNRADPASEEELLRISRPFWNHDGGTLCFGPDGYLYVALGDGGSANDPHDNGQNLKTLLGKIVRINVNKKSDRLPYAIPKDNPFVNRTDARPEIWAYGLRNVWRMSFDRKTGELWAADVGQNLYEEINRIERGGNYGWNRREALHPFGARGSGARKELIDPIWEYHHDVGKSITGGFVYRGQRLPELQGSYLYADYVSTKIGALRYDDKKHRVVANRPIRDPNVPVMSFGEDEKGEVYFLTYSFTGQGIYWFVKDQER